MKKVLAICMCLQVISQIGCDPPKESTVTIPNIGQIRGLRMVSASGNIFYAYRGVPYAKAPTGELRFQDPVAADPWLEKTLDATKEGPVCIQMTSNETIGVEDCLKLNVYTPDNSGSDNSSRPVMVWIHGGAWYGGNGNGETFIYGPRYFLDKDIVLVTINYRLGPLGFLTTEDAEAPGNYGLLDQNLALRWVRDHIGYFGGNSKLITIFGESAGAGSVSHHIVSPYSKGLFQRAIAQSGSSLNSWAVLKAIRPLTNMLAISMSCPISPSNELLACLRRASASDIAKFRKKVGGESTSTFGPRIDIERANPFLPADPKVLIKEKRFNAVPTIMGVNANEGAYFLAKLFPKDVSALKNVDSQSNGSFTSAVITRYLADANQDTRRIANRYLSSDKPFDEQLHQLEQAISDYEFFKGIDETVYLLSNYSDYPTYYYFYAHQSQLSLALSMSLPVKVNLGVGHTDELFLMFCNDLRFPCFNSSNDIKVSNILLDFWTSFAKDGVPRSKLVPGGWLPMERNQTRYMRIEADNPRTMNGSMPFSSRLLVINKDESKNFDFK